MIRIAIVEDDPLYQKQLAAYIWDYERGIPRLQNMKQEDRE